MSSIFTKDIAVMDVNSRLISAIIGVKKAQSVFGIKALVDKEHSGYQDGEWIDADETVAAASDALKEAMQVSGSRTKSVFVGVPSEFVAIVTKDVSVTLDRERRVIDADIDYLFKKGDNFDASKYIVIGSAAVQYSVDSSEKIYMDIRGINAVRIIGTITYMLCDRAFTEMFDSVCEKLGFSEIEYVCSAWAQNLALFEKEERYNDYMLVDIGYISSSVSIGRGEGLLQLASFSLGGGHISADLYEALEIPFALAEESRSLIDLNLNYADDAVIISDSRFTLYATDAAEVVRAKLDVFADIIQSVIDSADHSAFMPVFLTGEGVASMRGAKKYLSERLGKNIEIAQPKLAGHTSPSDSSKISLLVIAETLSKNGFGNLIKRAFNGGKK